jgi:hypothetical protein
VLSGLAGDALLSSLLIGPLAIAVAVRQRGATTLAVERRFGVVGRRVMLPVFLGLAALHTDLRELGTGALASVLALLGSRSRSSSSSPTPQRVLRALCPPTRTRSRADAVRRDRDDRDLLEPARRARHGRAPAPTLTLVGLVSTIAAGPWLPRTWLGATNGVMPAKHREPALRQP